MLSEIKSGTNKIKIPIAWAEAPSFCKTILRFHIGLIGETENTSIKRRRIIIEARSFEGFVHSVGKDITTVGVSAFINLESGNPVLLKMKGSALTVPPRIALINMKRYN